MMQHRLMWILWPAFLVAGVLEMAIFAMFDPHDMHWFGQPIEASRQTVYTLSFFALWLITSGASAMTCMLSLSPFEVNRCPLPATDRPDGCPKQCKH
ncbi:MAG: hypothetical protein QM527_12670 [Alphaproteobacteria bacterium]|nr:hypothetical protein [Alphaproteobacteria bacterium]